MAAVQFADGLRSQVAGRKDKWSKRVLAILDAKPSLARTLFLNRMEAHARVALGLGSREGIDWSQIDWSKILDFLLKLAAIILPLILAAKPAPAAVRKSKKGLGRTLTRKRL